MTREEQLETALVCVDARLQMLARSHGHLDMVVALRELIARALKGTDDEQRTLRNSTPSNNVTRAAKTSRGNAKSES